MTVAVRDRAGNESVAEHWIEGAGAPTPTSLSLGQNFPNPFNPETAIPMQVPVAGVPLRLRIYNTSGQLVRTLHDSPLRPGTHQLLWDGRDDAGRAVSSGVYLYGAEIGEFTRVRKMNLVR